MTANSSLLYEVLLGHLFQSRHHSQMIFTMLALRIDSE